MEITERKETVVTLAGIIAFGTGIFTIAISAALFNSDFYLGLFGFILGMGCAVLAGIVIPVAFLRGEFT